MARSRSALSVCNRLLGTIAYECIDYVALKLTGR